MFEFIIFQAEQCPGMDQYGINCLSKAYESMPRQLAENSGNDPSKAISKLLAAHAAMEGNLQGMAGGTLISSIYFKHLFHLFTMHDPDKEAPSKLISFEAGNAIRIQSKLKT